MTSDKAGGAIISWQDNRNGNNDIYAQRINVLGVAQWAADGAAICTWGGDDSYSVIVNDGANGAVIAWQRGNGIYAQKINSMGELQWTTGPLPITANTLPSVPAITSDEAGGAIVTWMDLRSNGYHIYAQRILASGTITWTINGIEVCINQGSQGYPAIVPNGLNGAFVSWNTPSPVGAYVQNLNADETIGPPATPIVSCAAGNTSITSNLTGASYQWQVNTGSGFTNIFNNSNYTGTNTVTLQLNNMPSGWYGYIYRCIVNGAYSTNSKLKFEDNWTGITDSRWENAANWSCGAIPDANTDVIINNGPVTVDVNTTIRTLTLAPGVIFTVAPGVILTIIH